MFPQAAVALHLLSTRFFGRHTTSATPPCCHHRAPASLRSAVLALLSLRQTCPTVPQNEGVKSSAAPAGVLGIASWHFFGVSAGPGYSTTNRLSRTAVIWRLAEKCFLRSAVLFRRAGRSRLRYCPSLSCLLMHRSALPRCPALLFFLLCLTAPSLDAWRRLRGRARAVGLGLAGWLPA